MKHETRSTEHQAAGAERQLGLRYDDLKPVVRSYVDKLHVQIDAILHKYGVKNPQEFTVKMREKGNKIKPEERLRVIELVGALIEAYKKDEVPFTAAVETAEKLSEDLNKRAQRFGLNETYEIHPPPVPEGLTAKHLEIAKKELGLEPAILPTADELHNLDENYLKMMYPEKQNEDDKKEGLKSVRPSWWKDNETDYVRSMKAELDEIGGSFILLDTATKPNYQNGKQHYGTLEGNDPTKDPLLPLFKQAFGDDSNRFNHTWDELQTKLLPIFKAKLQELWPDLPESVYEVILVPAILDNHHYTFRDPVSSATDTSDWTSTKVMDANGEDTKRRLLSGRSDDGGAGFVDADDAGDRNDGGGARLSVVFKKY